MTKRTVVVFGGGGYVGAVLTPMLLAEGYAVRVFDTFWYGKAVFTEEINNPNFELIAGDIRDLEAVRSALKGATDVIHLACISNDPSFDLDPELGKSIKPRSVLTSIISGIFRIPFPLRKAIVFSSRESILSIRCLSPLYSLIAKAVPSSKYPLSTELLPPVISAETVAVPIFSGCG